MPEGKANEKQRGPSATKEKQCNGKGKDLEKEAISLDLSEKDNAHLVQSDSREEAIKEGGNQEKSEEEFDSKEEEEEEGEIEMDTPSTKKARGRKTTKEVHEQATYNDKLQGSQLTLEKLLLKTRNTRQQGKPQKGMPSAAKSK